MRVNLPVPDAETLDAFLKQARHVWRHSHPDRIRKPGRPSHHDSDRRTIAEIAKDNCGVSSPEMEMWTQAKWIEELGKAPVTFKKNLKGYIQTTLFPLQMIPASMIQAKPLDDQLQHWYAMALSKAILSKPRPNINIISIPRALVNEYHRALCDRHIPKVRRRAQVTEAQRQAWFDRQWAGTKRLPVDSRKPAPTFTTPRKPRQQHG